MTTPMIDEHELALDYLYGMLDGDEKARFEAHLVGCARCQAELEANGRVRAVAKTVLPSVEPSDRLAGALHTQLMHEATKREARGKVLPFVRRLVRHPAYAAAAGLLIVGGAVGVQWSRGKLTMPAAPAAAKLESPAPTTPPPTTGTTATEGAAVPAQEAPVVATPAPALADGKASSGAVEKADKHTELSKGTVARDEPEKSANVLPAAKPKADLQAPKEARAEADDVIASRPAAHRGKSDDSLIGSLDGPSLGSKAGDVELERRAAPQASAAKNEAKRERSLSEESYDRASADEGSNANKKRATSTKDAEDVTPPPPAQRVAPTYAQNQPAYKSAYGNAQNNAGPGQSAGGGGSASATVAPSATPPAAPTPEGAPATTRNADPVEIQRSRAGRYADNDQCADAVRLYGDIDRRAPDRLSSQDRLSYARCLRVLGRTEPAQNELNQVAGQVPQPAYAAEQEQIDQLRRKQAAPARAAKAKRPAAADTALDSNAEAPSSAPSKK